MKIEGSCMRVCARTQALVLTSIATCFLSPSLSIAEPVRLEQAQKVTDTFLRTRNVQPWIGSAQLLTAAKDRTADKRVMLSGFREIRGDDGSLLAYIADLEPRGFVAVSASTDIVPIVACSFRSSFPPDGDRDSPLRRLLTEDMKLRTKALARRDLRATIANNDLWNIYTGEDPGEPAGGEFRQWPTENTTSTGGWLETAWHQDEPFNTFCPLDPIDGLRSYVGCVATAMAQIVNYHRQCNVRFDESDAYTSFAGIDIDGDSTLYDFPSLDELNEHFFTAQSIYDSGADLGDTDAAALSFGCGISCSMDYSSVGSGAPSHDAHRALLEKFGFHSAEMTGGMSRESFQLLQENIINGLPVYLGIAPKDGWGGHVVVCDGYNTDGKYHLNFGWGAPHPEPITEVWYHLPSDLLSDLSIVTEAILNVRPVEPLITVDPVSLSFNAPSGGESASKTLHLQSGPGGVSINSISSPEGFVLAYPGEDYSDHLEPVELQGPGSGTTLDVRFRPEQDGGYYGTLAINYNDGNVKYVALRGSSFSGGTQISAGRVSGTWLQSESPYFISGDIEVRDNGELTVEPGVRVVFVGHYGMTVGENARLVAVGNQNSPVEFTACNRNLGWSGLKFVDSGDDDILSYCSVTYAKKEAGLIATPSDPTEGEDADVSGAAIYCSFSSPTITSCRIANNESGAIHCIGSDVRITNTVIANNSLIGGRTQCGGIFAAELSRPEIKNCTIVNNSPGGILTEREYGIEVMNTILWGNDRYQILTSESEAEVSFCNVQDGYPGMGNMSADPSFFTPSPDTGSNYDGASANWTLRSSSPCINSGRQTNLPETDLAGNPRVSSYIVDIGAFENQSDLPLITIAPSATADAGFARLEAGTTVSVEIVNTGNLDFTIEGLSISDQNSVFTTVTQIDDHLLAPGDSVEAEVAFNPTAEQVYESDLVIHSTCSNSPDKRVSLRGVGVLGRMVPGGEVSGLWTNAESPYTITGDIYISKDRTLTIEPGVVVKFAGHFKFTIGYEATLRAIGTETQNIVFTAIDPNEGWFGMRFVSSGNDDLLEYCTIKYSKKPRTGGGGYENLMGGAILCCGSWDPGPGYLVPSSPTIRNCLIAENLAQYGGAIMCTDDSEALITGNRIVDNEADLGGAGMYTVYNVYGAPTVSNNVIAHNSAGVVGGGIMNWVGTPSIENNTIVHNRPSGLHLDSANLYPEWPSPPALILNNIVWQNEIYLSEEVLPNEYDIRFNNIQGGWDAEGNIDVDPLFADAENRDYHLMSQAGCWDLGSSSWIVNDVTSPCIDAGDPIAAVGDEPTPHGGRINMGAYGSTSKASKSF
jgi:hypothetical protein